MNQLKEKQPEFYHDYIEPLQTNKKVQHAYLIETNFVKEKENYVLAFVEMLFQLKLKEEKLEKEKLHQMLVNKTFPDLKILVPSGSMIKKEELLQLKTSFQEKAVYDGYQIYVIFEAEKLNAASANTILKFLEEPEDDIIAVLVTDTRYKMLDTILSRCQVLSFQKEADEEVNILDETQFFFQQIARRNQENLFLNYQAIFEKVCNDKQQTVKIVQELLQFFSKKLQAKYASLQESTKKIEEEDTFSETEILAILSILQKKQEALQYNVNIKLWLDSLLIALMEV